MSPDYQLTAATLRVRLTAKELSLRRGWPPVPETVWNPRTHCHRPLSEHQRRRWGRIHELARRYFRKGQTVTRIARKLKLPHQTVSDDLALFTQRLIDYGWLLNGAGRKHPVEVP